MKKARRRRGKKADEKRDKMKKARRRRGKKKADEKRLDESQRK